MRDEPKSAEIPAEWEITPIGEKFVFTTKPRDLRLNDHRLIPFVPMDRIPSDRLFFSDYVNRNPKEVTSGTYFEEGDLLVSKITPCFENGKQGIANNIPGGFGVATTEVIPIKAMDGVSCLPFLAMYLLDQDVRNSLASKMEGATGRQRLAKSVLEEWTMPFPPLPEQRAIALVLSKIQAAMEVQEKIVTTLKELKAAPMAKLFREGLRGEPLKQTEIGEIPESWEVVRLGDLVEVRGGKRLLKGESFADSPTNFPYIRVVDLKDNGVDTSDLRYLTPEVRETIKRYVITTKDIYISIAGTTGLVGVIPDTLDGANLTENAARLIIKDSKRIDRDFLMWFLAGNVGQEQISSLTGKTSQPKLALSRTETIKVPVPALTDEQLSIANLLNKQRQSYLSAASKRDAVKSLFSSMLHLLMTGQVRVKVLGTASKGH